MKRATWLRKALILLPLILLVLGIIAVIGGRYYLSSGRATPLVAEQLQDMLGGRVEVQNANIGLIGDSTVQGIKVFADDDPGKPWLQFDDVQTDASALSLLRGKTPEAIQLKGARIALRFDTAGHLLTQLPKSKGTGPAKLPRLHLENGELTLAQEHRPSMIIQGISADITSGEGGMELIGNINDPFWGNWKAQASFDAAGDKAAIVLDATEIEVTMKKLKFIPFVPPSVWDEIHVEGHTPAQVRLDLTTGEKAAVSYRVEVTPRDALVRVPAIDLEATQSHGKAIVQDEIVQLEGVHGKTAGGAISADGKLNFHDRPTRMKLQLGVKDVVLHDLPRSWKLPSKIDGRLTGAADLAFVINQGKTKIDGKGRGTIDRASVLGFKIRKPIQLALGSVNGRLKFVHSQQATVNRGDAPPPAPKPETSVDRTPQPETPKRQTEKPDLSLEPAQERVIETRQAEPEEGAIGLLEEMPGQVVNLLGRGIQLAANGLGRGINATTDALNKLQPPSKPGEEPTYLDVDLGLQDVDLAQLLQRLKLNLPYPLTGRLTFQVHASIPVNTAGDLKAYRLRGTAKLSRFTVDGLEMSEVEARVKYANGLLDLEDLRGKMPLPNDPKTAGKFKGNARVQVVPQGELRAALQLDAVPLDVALRLLPAAEKQASGAISGTVQGRVPMVGLSDPANWRGAATLTAPALTVYGLALKNASANVRVDEGKATLATLKADLEGTPVTGKGEIRLKDAYPFQGEIHLGRTDLAMLNRLAPSLRPPVKIAGRAELDGVLTGTVKPFAFDANGTVKANDLMADGFKVAALSFRWMKEKNALKLDKIQADLYGGDVSGSAVVPLAADALGSAKLRVRDLNVQAMAKALPVFPVRVEGKVSGTVNGALAAAKENRPRAWTTDMELTAPKLRIQGIPAEKLKGSLDSRGGKTSYALQGGTLGGTFSLKGDLPPAATEQPKEEKDKPLGRGRFEIRDARLSSLWDAYDISGGLSHLNGRFSLNLPYTHSGKHFFPAGNGTFQIANVRWDGTVLSDSLQGDVRLTADALRLVNLTGDAAGGVFLGRFTFGLKSNSRSWFHIDLQQVEAARLLVPLPSVAARVKGSVDVNLRGRIGPEWNGSGGATLTRGQIYGMDITEWRVPLTFSFSPAQGSGELTIRDSAARIAQGRARFDSTLNWGNGLRLAGKLLFFQVDLRTLLRHSPSLSSYASGRVSGRVDLSGSEMRSINDLRALVHAKLHQGQALQLPVLRQITPYLRAGASSATFKSGQMKGRLANGVFTVQHLALVGNLLQLLAEGTITMAGRLDLEVTAQTGLFCLNPNKQNSVRSRIPLLGAIPRMLLFEASSLIAAQVVHLKVTGTVSSPSIRVEPLVTLTEDAARFFFGRLLAPSIPNVP